MDNSIKSLYQTLNSIVHLLHFYGIREAVVSPGSRNAPLLMVLEAQKTIKLYQWVDERSAAYAALGMAQANNRPVLIVCTSGTAALNYAPAVAEAFYSETPLVVLTADRPIEAIGQRDNQAIWQDQLFQPHTLYSQTCWNDISTPSGKLYAQRIAQEAMNHALQGGPVHINIPIREPFYPCSPEIVADCLEQASIPAKPFIVHRPTTADPEWKYALAPFEGKGGVLIVGDHFEDGTEAEALLRLRNMGWVILADVGSQYANMEGVSVLQIIPQDPGLQPDVVVYLGRNLLSKTWRQWVKQLPTCTQLIHGISGPHIRDVFDQGGFALIGSSISMLMKAVEEASPVMDSSFYDAWGQFQISSIQSTSRAFPPPAELAPLLQALPTETTLHLGNSLPVRWASQVPVWEPGVQVRSNRGTSGIDGCISSAAGHSLAQPHRLHFCLIGDLSTVYDSNGLWNPLLANNLVIVVAQNRGGGIFRGLPGASALSKQSDLQVAAASAFVNFSALAAAYNCQYATFQEWYPNLLLGKKPWLSGGKRPWIVEWDMSE